jgi:hypothetical protein
MLAPIILVLVGLACVNPNPEVVPRLAGTVTNGNSTPIAKADAVSAIQTYARDILGIDMPNLKAGGRSGEINLPVSTREGVEVAIDLAGTTYFGIWKQGVASLSVGDSAVSGNLFADVQDGSLGAFLIRVDQTLPPDAGTALGLILTTCPGLNGYDFFEIKNDEIDDPGFEFKAGQADDVQIQSWEVTLTGTTITAGVTPAVQDGKSIVWVVVASGALAAPFGN